MEAEEEEVRVCGDPVEPVQRVPLAAQVTQEVRLHLHHMEPEEVVAEELMAQTEPEAQAHRA
jgi:hypothetical protein